MTDASAALLLKDVTKVFKVRQRHPGKLFSTPTEVVGINNVSLRIGRGEVVGVIGENGSGKTTLLKLMSGALTPTRGKVMAPHRPRLISLNGIQLPNLTVLENAELVLRAHGRSKNEARLQALELISSAELTDKAHLPYETLSTGMRARLGFFLAATNRPEMLLLDETLSVGDIRFAETAKRVFSEVVRGAGAVALASHSRATLVTYCSRTVVLHSGSVIFDGNPSEAWDVHTQLAGRISAPGLPPSRR